MMNASRTVFLLLVFHSTISAAKSEKHHIIKRSLLFPQYTVLQFTYGVSAPVILPKRSINLSLCMQCNFELPFNVTQLRPTVVSARSVQDFDYDLDRSTFYKYIVEFLDGFGLNGEKCLLKSICEVAEIPMHVEESDSLLESVVHFLLTPSQDFSVTNRMGNFSCDRSDCKFLKAENLGRTNGNCHQTFSECSVSLVDLFTKIFHV